MVEVVEPPLEAAAALELLRVANILTGERQELSEQERAIAMARTLSHDAQNAVVINWNGALLLGDDPETDVPLLLELAGMQLLEMRAYEATVSSALERFYHELERPPTLFASARYRRLSREIMRLFVDVNEATDRVENSLQLLGDTWLARVHRAAVDELGVLRWQKRLADGLTLLHQINEMVVDQVTTRQSLRLEAAIVLLIVLEILFALFRVY
jgi:hypothetical protein